MNWCENCQQLEGKTKWLSETPEKPFAADIQVCAECEEEITRVPEHDDLFDR